MTLYDHYSIRNVWHIYLQKNKNCPRDHVAVPRHIKETHFLISIVRNRQMKHLFNKTKKKSCVRHNSFSSYNILKSSLFLFCLYFLPSGFVWLARPRAVGLCDVSCMRREMLFSILKCLTMHSKHHLTTASVKNSLSSPTVDFLYFFGHTCHSCS